MSFEWSEVTQTRPVGTTLLHLRLTAPPAQLPRFTTPGQYTQLKVGGAMGYFAIASPPGATEFEFLVKRGSPIAEALARCQQGDALEVGPIAGNGFPLERALGRDLVLVATGTGSAPMRSVLEAVRARRSTLRRVVFVHGVRHHTDVGWEGDAPKWREAGVEWRLVVSQPTSGWSGRTGHVQHHLEALGLERATVFLCGQKSMVTEVTRTLVEQGLPPTQVFLNT